MDAQVCTETRKRCTNSCRVGRSVCTVSRFWDVGIALSVVERVDRSPPW